MQCKHERVVRQGHLWVSGEGREWVMHCLVCEETFTISDQAETVRIINRLLIQSAACC